MNTYIIQYTMATEQGIGLYEKHIITTDRDNAISKFFENEAYHAATILTIKIAIK